MAILAVLALGLSSEPVEAKGRHRGKATRAAKANKRNRRGPVLTRHQRNQLRNGIPLVKPKPVVKTEPVRGTARNRGRVEKHLKKSAEMLRQFGISKLKARDVAHHIGLGMPSQAGRQNPNDYLLARNQYVVGYSRDLVGPRWVSWRVRPHNVNGKIKRRDRFREDRTLPKSWPRAQDEDFKDSGQTRGHLVGSFMRTVSRRANSKTFVFSNILPQAENNNSGPWLHLEQHYVNLASKGHVVFSVAGGIFPKKPKRIGENKVAVPKATWKMVVVLDKGQTIHDINEKTRVISVIVPNSNKKVHKRDSYEQYLVSPRVIEQKTGLKMLSAVPEEIRRVLLDRVDSPKHARRQADPRVASRTRKSLARIAQRKKAKAERKAAKTAKKAAAKAAMADAPRSSAGALPRSR